MRVRLERELNDATVEGWGQGGGGEERNARGTTGEIKFVLGFARDGFRSFEDARRCFGRQWEKRHNENVVSISRVLRSGPIIRIAADRRRRYVAAVRGCALMARFLSDSSAGYLGRLDQHGHGGQRRQQRLAALRSNRLAQAKHHLEEGGRRVD